jgi:hypothetical protein
MEENDQALIDWYLKYEFYEEKLYHELTNMNSKRFFRVNTFNLPTPSKSLNELSDGIILIAILAEM